MPNLRDRGDHRGRRRDLVAAQPWVFKQPRIDPVGSCLGRQGIGWVTGSVEYEAGRRPIERTRVEMSKAEMLGETLSERTLAGSSRSVDRDDKRAAPLTLPSRGSLLHLLVGAG
jgi:hypothetical protein